jgi:hypothetical protein
MQYNQYPGEPGGPAGAYNQYNQPVQNNQPVKSGRVALRWGLIIGIILAVVNDSIYVISSLVSAHSLSGISSTSSSIVSAASGVSLGLSCLAFLLGLAAYFVSGILASRQTALVRTGVFAGMWTGGVYGVIDLVVKLIVIFTITLPAEQAILSNASAVTAPSQFIAIGAILEVIVALLLAVGVGAGLGALGGLIGRSNARKRMPQQVYAEQMYQPPIGGPYAPYPQNAPAPFAPPYGDPAQGAPNAGYPNYPGYPSQPSQPSQPAYNPQSYQQPPQASQAPVPSQSVQPQQQTPVDDRAGNQATNVSSTETDSSSEPTTTVATDADATRPASGDDRTLAEGDEPTIRADPSKYPRYPEQ